MDGDDELALLALAPLPVPLGVFTAPLAALALVLLGARRLGRHGRALQGSR